MNLSYASKRTPGMRPTLRSRDQQAFCQRPGIKSAVEAIGKGAKILLSILAEAKAVVTATLTGLEIAQRCAVPQRTAP